MQAMVIAGMLIELYFTSSLVYHYISLCVTVYIMSSLMANKECHEITNQSFLTKHKIVLNCIIL